MEVKDVLRNLREKNKLTQEQLAQRIHVTRQAISRWETGMTQPGPELLKVLSREFGVSLLFDGILKLFFACVLALRNNSLLKDAYRLDFMNAEVPRNASRFTLNQRDVLFFDSLKQLFIFVPDMRRKAGRTKSDMKKITLLLCLVFCVSPVWAQKRHELNAFIGGFFSDYVEYGGSTSLFSAQNASSVTGDLWDLYEAHYSLHTGPVATIDYHYIVLPFLRVGAQCSFGSMAGNTWHKIGNKPAEDFRYSAVSLLPEIKACIPGMRKFRVYGKAAAGVQYRFGTHVSAPVGFAWEVVPVGFEWGGHTVYGNMEFCWGSVIRGGRIGLGFCF